MRPHYTLTTAATTEPLTLGQVTSHVRIDSNDDLEYLQDLIAVAREYVDSITGRVSIQSTWKVTAPSWHAMINGDDNRLWIPSRNVYAMPLYRTPLVSVSSVKYYAPDASSQTTIASTEYNVITGTEPGIVQFKDAPPSVDDRPDAVEINFVAGYADSCATPPGLKHAQKMIVAHLYENRLPVSFASFSNLPFSLYALLEDQKVGGWIA